MDHYATFRLALIVLLILIVLVAFTLRVTHDWATREIGGLKENDAILRRKIDSFESRLGQLEDTRLPRLEGTQDKLSVRCRNLAEDLEAIQGLPGVQSELAARSALKDLGLG